MKMYAKTKTGKIAAELRKAGHEEAALRLDQLHTELLDIAAYNVTDDISVVREWARRIVDE